MGVTSEAATLGTNSPSAEVPQERIILESNRECGKGVMRFSVIKLV
jgi:hypothetical protein